ncbi:MAG TPA: YqcC family protein [Pyrinomonadaceae bacterium]|nr:YqcC family protein [Pyrinomonadaceae bacterium]
MNKLLLWLLFCLGAAAFVLGVSWFADGNLLGYALTPLGLAVLLWSALKLRRISLRGNLMTAPQNPPDYAAVAAKLDEIEAEMKRIGMWQEQPLPPEQYAFRQAFAGDTMAFDQWLQFILLPRAREIVSTRGRFPPFSEVSAQAAREFDTHPLDTSRLQTLLYEFDRLFGPPRF